jgi:zinc protease
MSLLADILGGGNQSRLYQTLTVEKKIAAYAGAWFSADMLDYGTIGVYAAPNEGVSVEDVEKGVDTVLADLMARGVTQEELDRSRNSVIASATYLLDSQEALARLFGVALTTGQTIEDVMNWERDIALVTVDDVNKAARTAFDARASVTGVLLPEAKIQ